MYRDDGPRDLGGSHPASSAGVSEALSMNDVQEAQQIGLGPFSFALKRLFDLISIVVILALFGWLMILIALAVRLSSGPGVIYGHQRVGKDGRLFNCYKFRSMVANSDEVLQELLDGSPEARAEWERDFKLKDDPRITRVGRFIRKTSLDELPQLWNVVCGEMSIVGPRPVVQAELDRYYGDAKAHYHSVPPGLTGLWQVSGRNDLDYDQRVQLDKAYVENWNVFTDFMIVMRTVKVMVGRHGAY
ncbi:MAG TPA: sugar transferase [Ideonella sp.]|uniref:sugar transferase n=2 Tax=Ideonella sp. TaxID=1929293 RepID=UPI002B9022DE|nr:sugar transferase [Ideonella sp.]